jgi:hypothetical protein
LLQACRSEQRKHSICSTCQTASQSQGKAAKLGDLSAFRSIATDVAAIVDKGDLPAPTASRIWSRMGLGRSRTETARADDWHVLDKAIDKACRRCVPIRQARLTARLRWMPC